MIIFGTNGGTNKLYDFKCLSNRTKIWLAT